MSRYSNFLDMYRLVLFGCFLGTCVAHMCLVTPQQRGKDTDLQKQKGG